MKVLLAASDLSENGGIQRYNKFLLRAVSQGAGRAEVCELKGRGLLAKIAFILKLKIKLLFFRPDFIFCSHISFAPLILFFRRFFGFKWGIMAYGIEVWDIKEKSKIHSLEKADIIFSISNFTKSKIIGQFPQAENKITILPNPIDGEEFPMKEKPDYLLKRHNLKNKKIILTVARLSPLEKYKGYDKVIEGLPLVLSRFPEAKYVIVGEGGDRNRVEDLIKKMNLKDSVIMAGYVPDRELADYYNLCDVFAMPSKGEGFGFVFLEALSCGKPVVAGNSDGSRDAVLDGKLGLLVNPDDKKEIAEAIIKILEKSVPENILDGAHLRKSVLENYGVERFNQRIRDILSKI
jgi:glycosyltransferase involved in cell wall biosynthesis